MVAELMLELSGYRKLKNSRTKCNMEGQPDFVYNFLGSLTGYEINQGRNVEGELSSAAPDLVAMSCLPCAVDLLTLHNVLTFED